MKKNRIYSAFTLAEMMVVMLILSIVMAAFAPVVTTRSKADFSSPWRRASNNSDIYFGLGENQTAMIGQPNKNINLDPSARLIINTSGDNQKHIVFKRGEDNLLGSLQMAPNNSILLGNLKSGNIGTFNTLLGTELNIPNNVQNNVMLGNRLTTKGSGSVTIGTESDTQGSASIAIGTRAGTSTASSKAIVIGSELEVNGENAIAIGQDTGANYEIEGNNSILIGKGNLSGQKSVGIGNNITISNSDAVVVGGDSKAEGNSSVAIGSSAITKDSNSISIGRESTVKNNSGIAMGYQSSSIGSSAIAIGNGAETYRLHGIAIGTGATTGTSTSSSWGDYSIAIGKDAKAGGDSNVSIGNNAGSAQPTSSNYNIAIGYYPLTNLSSGSNNIAIGNNAARRVLNTGSNNIAIGNMACDNVSGSNKICIGNDSGPNENTDWARDDEERIFIGSTSKFNGGAAVLEVHNKGSQDYYSNNWRKFHDTTVIINGNLVVKGGIVGALPWVDDRDIDGDGDATMLGRTKGQLEPLPMDGGDNSQFGNYYGSAEHGRFKTPNYWKEITWWSDRRLKYVGSEVTTGLDKIRQLKVFNYTFKNDKKKTPRVGVIAQDLQKVFPDAVKKGDDGYLTIRWDDMFYAVINAIKELDAKVSLLVKHDSDKDIRIKALEDKNKTLEAKNNALEARLKRLEDKLK